MIALCIITYIVVGFLLSMVGTFISKRAGIWDDETKGVVEFCIILWPLYIVIGIISGTVIGLSIFYDWFAGCFKEKDKEK